jgi:hypothetical protein
MMLSKNLILLTTMKSFSTKSLLTIVLLSSALACNDLHHNDETLRPTDTISESDANKEMTSGKAYEAEGLFLYKTLKFHAGYFDPYSLLSSKDGEKLKLEISRYKTTSSNAKAISGSSASIWSKAANDKLLTTTAAAKVIEFDREALEAIKSDATPRVVDKWLSTYIIRTVQNSSLSFDEKSVIVNHCTIMRYAMKAYLETKAPMVKSANGRQTNSCLIDMISCYWDNISKYSGIGKFVAGGPGGTAGAIIGAFISFDSCTCESSCRYPQFISTPDVCYSPYGGFDMLTGGFGEATNNLFWEFLDTQGIPFLTKSTTKNAIRIYDSELEGRTFFYARVTANCSGGNYTTEAVGFDLTHLGKPSFFLSGNTYPQVGTQQFYSINGRNLNSVSWGVGSIGQKIAENSYGINVNWTSTGYAYLYANAQSSCGSINNGLNIVVHN